MIGVHFHKTGLAESQVEPGSRQSRKQWDHKCLVGKVRVIPAVREGNPRFKIHPLCIQILLAQVDQTLGTVFPPFAGAEIFLCPHMGRRGLN